MNRKNVILIASLWTFAVLLSALVITLMILRGPAVTP